MTYLKYVILLMIALLLVGCGKKDPLKPTADPDPTNEIMPLRVGIIWTYILSVYSPPSPDPMEVMDYFVEILNQTTIGEEQWYRSRHIFTNGTNADTVFWYYTVRDSGLCVRATPTDPVYLKLKFPAGPGDGFQGFNEFLYHIFSFGVTDAQVISLNALVTVPFGTFPCIYSRLAWQGEVILDEHYNPGVGMVSSETLIFDGVSTWATYIKLELRGINLP